MAGSKHWARRRAPDLGDFEDLAASFSAFAEVKQGLPVLDFENGIFVSELARQVG